MKRRYLVWPLLALIYLPLVIGVLQSGDTDAGASSRRSQDAGATTGPVTVTGSSTVEPISIAVAERFADVSPGSEVDVDGPGTGDGFQLFCDGEVAVTLTAPAGATMRLDVLRDGRPLGSAVSDGRPATVVLREDGCGADDAGELQARVSWSGAERSAAPYRLVRSGSY